MKPALAPIIRDSQRLLRELVRTAACMPKDYKWMLGARLRDNAMEALLLSRRAFRMSRRPDDARAIVERVAALNDEVQELLQVAYEVGALPSRGRLQELAVLAKEIGKQCGGWAAALSGKHPNGQSSAASSRPKRAGTLSTRDASSAGGQP